jgi:archaellin
MIDSEKRCKKLEEEIEKVTSDLVHLAIEYNKTNERDDLKTITIKIINECGASTHYKLEYKESV